MFTQVGKTVLLAISCCAFAAGGAAMAAEGAGGEQTHPMKELLARLGDACSLYFTVEEAWTVGEPPTPIYKKRVQLDVPERVAADEAIEAIRKALPDAVVRRSETVPAIVHIMDRRLVGLKDYALDAKLPKIRFEGSPTALVERIKSEVKTIPKVSVLPVNSTETFVDFKTRVRVDARDASVRQILSDYVPLAGYARVIWVAETTLGEPLSTQVFFKGNPRAKAGGMGGHAAGVVRDDMSNLIDQALDAYDRISNAFVDRAYEKAVPWLAKGAVPYMPADVPRTDESIPKYVGTFKLEIPAANVEAMANMAKDWRTLAAGLGPAQVEIFSSSRFLELKRGSGEYGPIQLGSHTIVRVPCPGSEEIGRRYATEARSSGCLSMTREKGLVIVMIRIGDDWFWVPFGW